MVAFEIQPEYGWVILGTGVGTFFTSFYLGGAVMSARKRLNIEYPNAYAVPGYHKNADEFNRVQRSHQNYLENVGGFVVLNLIGGLKYPLANAIGSVFFCLGSILYMKGYSDNTLEVQTARYKKGGVIKYIGLLIALGSTCQLAYSMITSQ